MAVFSRFMVVCSDLERSKKFYRTIMELDVVTDASPLWIEFALGENGTLVLYPANDMLPVRRGSVQMGFAVEDVDTFVIDARTAGVEVLQDPYPERSGRIAVIADPDGYPIQVATLVDGEPLAEERRRR